MRHHPLAPPQPNCPEAHHDGDETEYRRNMKRAEMPPEVVDEQCRDVQRHHRYKIDAPDHPVCTIAFATKDNDRAADKSGDRSREVRDTKPIHNE